MTYLLSVFVYLFIFSQMVSMSAKCNYEKKPVDLVL